MPFAVMSDSYSDGESSLTSDSETDEGTDTEATDSGDSDLDDLYASFDYESDAGFTNTSWRDSNSTYYSYSQCQEQSFVSGRAVDHLPKPFASFSVFSKTQPNQKGVYRIVATSFGSLTSEELYAYLCS